MCVLGVGAQVLIEYLFNMFETLGSTPSTLMAAHTIENSSFWGSCGPSELHRHLVHIPCMDTNAGKIQ